MSQLLDKETLKKMIRENVKTLYRKTLEAASAEEVYQAAVFAVRDVILSLIHISEPTRP